MPDAAPPAYALLPNRLVGMPPSLLKDTRMTVFCAEGDPARIQAALDAMFAAPTGGAVRYTAASARLILSVAEVPRTIALSPTDHGNGTFAETEVALWAMAHVPDDPLEFRAVPLILFVDSAPALATGREIYGFPKQIGRFDFSADAPRRFAIDSYVMPRFTPDCLATWARVIEIEPLPDVAPATFWETLEDLAGGVAERIADLALEAMPGLTKALGLGTSHIALLKQFPDAADPLRACYQAVVEAQTQVTLRRARVTDRNYRVRFTSYASHNFADWLGLQNDWIACGTGLEIECDAVMGLGKTVWGA